MKRKRALLFGGGRPGVDPGKIFRDSDVIICADGGYDYALQFGLKPDIVIGDMDSVAGNVNASQTVVYPVRKDFTDGELVMDYALEQDFEEIIMLGFTGTRMDHTLTNIAMMRKASLKGIPCVMLDETNEIYYITKKLCINGEKGDLLSIIPMGGHMKGVKTQALEYPLQGETLYYGQSRGVSNVMTGDKCVICVEEGEGIVTKSRDI